MSIFLAACTSSKSPEKFFDQPVSIDGVKKEFYTNGNFSRSYLLAAAACKYSHKKHEVKPEAEALLWMASIKKMESAYRVSFNYLGMAKPLLKSLRNDSLFAEFDLIKADLFTETISPDSAKWYYQQAKKKIGTANQKNKFQRARLDLSLTVLYTQLHQPKKTDSLTRQAIGELKDEKNDNSYYYKLALLNRVLFINENGTTDSAAVLARQYAADVDRAFPKNNYLHALLYHSLADVSINNMDYTASVKYADKEMAYAKASNNFTTRFYAYGDMQQAYFYSTDFKSAITLTDSMNSIRKITFPEKSPQSSIINNSYGRIFTNMHDYDKAKYYFLKNAKTNNSLFAKNSEELITFYSNMANLYSYQEKYDSVLYYYQKVLAMDKNIYPKDNISIAFCMDDMARTYNNLEKPELALPLQLLVEKIYKKKYPPTHSYISWAYDEEAVSYIQLKQYDKALLYNNKALAVFIPQLQKENDALSHTAAIPFDIYIPDYLTDRVDIFYEEGLNEKDDRQKIKYLQQAYSLCSVTNNYVQSYTSHFDSPESIASVYQRMDDYYKLGADICYQLYLLTGQEIYKSSLLNYSENKRGAFLRSNVLSAKSLQFSGVPVSVIKKEAKIRNEVTAAADKSTTINKKDSVNHVYENFLGYLSKNFPDYYQLKYLPYQMDDKAIRRWLPDDKTVFTEFMITKKQLYAILIDKTHTSIIKLDKRDSILNQVSTLNNLLQTNNALAYYSNAYSLYSYLFKPLEPYIKPGDKIVISGDGPLAALSFEALVSTPNPATDGFNSNDFLVNKYNISYAISAFSLLNPFNKVRSAKANNGAYYAAPGFDDKLKDDYKTFAAVNKLPLDKDYLAYLYQPFMVQLGNVLSNTWNVTHREGNDATETDFKQKAPGNNILQIGSHAILNNIDPMRSCLVFAKELSKDSAVNDGYLYSSEIFNQKLNADLIILTACETGGGKYKEGEGMMSLSYSFEYAGCKSAIMSLWPIDEKTASAITKLFYDHLGEGKTTAEALYQAKKDFLKTADAGFINPFYWSGLVLLGADEKIQLHEKNVTDKYGWLLGSIGIAAAAAAGFKKWKKL